MADMEEYARCLDVIGETNHIPADLGSEIDLTPVKLSAQMLKEEEDDHLEHDDDPEPGVTQFITNIDAYPGARDDSTKFEGEEALPEIRISPRDLDKS